MTPPPRLILASASPRRRELLRSLGLEFEIVPSDAPELHDTNIPVAELCKLNAVNKAKSVAEQFPEALVIGADTLVALNREIYGKPTSLGEAREMLRRLQGHTHHVVTGVALLHHASSRSDSFAVETSVTFRALNDEQIEIYIAAVHVLDKAGAYGIQEKGDMIVEKICGSFTNVVGLPLEELSAHLQKWEIKSHTKNEHEDSSIHRHFFRHHPSD
jgi:septum formation protein